MTTLTDEIKKEIEAEIKSLEETLTGNMMQDMDVRDKIHNLKMKLNGVRPADSFVECVGCGS
ncbi:MAG: hypothetical protein CME69_07130 [Halobacteriovorax sp.]|nr:hypothetical protein [Halobacteriovorax sp.]MEE3077804.1 hypothetical protein [Bdellovibrionota bacterium]